MQKDPYESKTFGNSLSLRVDGAIGAMSLSPNGRDAVLAGRRGLFIIDLDDPFTTPRWLHHITSWEVADVQWSPHHFAKRSWCISTSNQKALLWDLSRPSDNSIINVLHEHTRAITDINFHPSDPEILATCSIDTFVLSWDMRTPRKAVQQWAEWRAGATQVKWNHENPYEIASSHDHAFYIWDTRKGALPILKIDNAHSGKINGIDFSHGLSRIITCSNDHKIKYWDLTNKNFKQFNYDDSSESIQPAVIINTDFPVSRARSLPFGNEKACGIMPLRDGQDSIHIVNCDQALEQHSITNETQVLDFNPVYSFKGHGGPIKDFLWRTRHESYDNFDSKRGWKDYQLVTWSSTDYDLKLWPDDEDLYKKVNYNPLYQKALKVFPSVNETGSSSSTPAPSITPVPASSVDSTANSIGSSHLENKKYNYETYCIEPPITLNNILAKNKGDLLSAMTMFQIAKKHKYLPSLPTQLNHLDWISGVRMGHDEQDKINDSPSNLGEEVSMVAHTFPKVRFEKISISTGQLILSLRGPMPVLPNTQSVSNTETSSVIAPKKEEENDDTRATDTSFGGDHLTVDDNKSTNDDTIDETNDNEQKLIFIRLEINFPRNYPYLEDTESKQSIPKRHQKQFFVSFEIEETHELTKEIKDEMLSYLKQISEFYSNKHQRYCLEPLLRYLMGDKVILDDSLFEVKTPIDDSEVIQEVGEEGWADDLINQQPQTSPLTSPISGEEESISDSDLSDDLDGQVSDFMPGLNDEDMLTSNGSLTKFDSAAISRDRDDVLVENNRYYDSTPLPKGCGAVWGNNGQLVCFFIPKNSEDEDNKPLQKFSIFKFTDAGFSLNSNEAKNESESDNESINEESNNEDDSESSSSDSFDNDWDDIEEDDLTSRFRVPGLFKTSVGLGNRYYSKVGSGGGDGSNYKSSNPGESLDTKKRKKQKSPKNIVEILDFRYLLPDKQELANEYRVLGASPESLANYNSQVALKYGLTEIAGAWKLLEMVLLKDIQINSIHPVYLSSDILNPNSTVAKNVEAMNHLLHLSEETKKLYGYKNYRFYWGTHPFGHSWLIEKMMSYFEAKGNLQMLVMLSCILYENQSNFHSDITEGLNIPIHTPYQTRPQPPSKLQLKQLNESFEFDPSDRDRSGERPDYRGHRNSSLSIFKKDQKMPIVYGTSYARSINSDSEAISETGSLGRGSIGRGSVGRGSVGRSGSFIKSGSFAKSFPNLSPDYDIKIKRQSSKLTEIKKPKPAFKRSSKRSVQPPPEVTIEFDNLDTLDIFDDLYTSPLLSSQNEDKIKAYRERYADMLYAWGLSANRIKILKFNFPSFESQIQKSRFSEHECGFGYRVSSLSSSTDGKYVNNPTKVITVLDNPWFSNKRDLKYCNLCNLLVTKRLVICTNCEHILHADCALQWWGEDQETECPSGCGCQCVNLTR